MHYSLTASLANDDEHKNPIAGFNFFENEKTIDVTIISSQEVGCIKPCASIVVIALDIIVINVASSCSNTSETASSVMPFRSPAIIAKNQTDDEGEMYSNKLQPIGLQLKNMQLQHSAALLIATDGGLWWCIVVEYKYHSDDL